MSTIRLVEPNDEGFDPIGEEPDDDTRLSLTYEPHNLASAVVSAVTQFAKLDAVYRQHGRLVIAQRTENGIALHELTRPLARSALTECMVFIGPTGKKGQMGPILPPTEVIDASLQKRDLWHSAAIRICNGVSRLPACRDDGSIITPGYDPVSKRIIDFNGEIYPMPGSTHDDAAAALARINDLLCDFPFCSDLDRAVAVSLLVTAVHRCMMRVCPAYLIDSPSPEIGKSLIVDLASALLIGKRADVWIPTTDRDELRKRIFSQLLSGAQHIAIDNIDLPFGGPPFDVLISQERYGERVLGASQVDAPSTVALVTLTGRNVKFLGDGALRTLRARMETDSERPGTSTAKRKYPHVFDYVVKNRTRLASDCVTIARAYLLAGRPGPTQLREFDDWCMRVREPLIWLGMPDVAESIERQRLEGDETVSSTVELMRAWTDLYGEKPVVVPSMIHELKNTLPGPDRPKYDRLSYAIEVFCGAEISQKNCARTLSAKLHPNAGRPLHGMVLRRLARIEDGVQWQIVASGAKRAVPASAKPSEPEDFFGIGEKKR